MKPTAQHTSDRSTATDHADHADRFIRTRQRTFAALGRVTDHDLERVHSTLLSPIVWDLAHIGAFVDLWLAQVTGRPLLREDLAITYDASETPRAGRGALEMLDHRGARDYLAQVDEALFAALPSLDLSPSSPDPLLRDGFVIDLLVEHEEQHRETILQTLHLAEAGVHEVGPPAAWAPTPTEGPLMVPVPGGRPQLGATSGFSYDNERSPHVAAVSAFRIDRIPVTVGAFRDFVEDGGYDDHRFWEPEGWIWRQREGVERPMFWEPDGRIRRFDRLEEPGDDQPVMNVSWFEADAYARWRGARLPTEIEWETAARHDAAADHSRRQPWGDAPHARELANVGGEALGPLRAGSAGAAPCGALGMIGDVWEWTSSRLQPYPGFRAFPYPEYSQIFFDGPYRVLRGGSWATASECARATFRNWDHPQRRQIFAGFRCAADA